MQDLTSNDPTSENSARDQPTRAERPQYAGLFKAVLIVVALYYILFAGLGFNTDTELKQFLDEAATRPEASEDDADAGGI